MGGLGGLAPATTTSAYSSGSFPAAALREGSRFVPACFRRRLFRPISGWGSATIGQFSTAQKSSLRRSVSMYYECRLRVQIKSADLCRSTTLKLWDVRYWRNVSRYPLLIFYLLDTPMWTISLSSGNLCYIYPRSMLLHALTITCNLSKI